MSRPCPTAETACNVGWSLGRLPANPNGDNPHEEDVYKPVAFVFDFAPTRALRQLSDYGIGLSPDEPNPERAVEELVSFLPVLAYDGSRMVQIDAGGILDMAMAGTSATRAERSPTSRARSVSFACSSCT